MGLDMYMSRVKKIDGMTLKEIYATADYIDWLKRPEKYKDNSPEQWNGCDEDKVRKDKLDEVEANIKTRYSAWDTEKEYGHDGVSEGVAYWRKANAIHKWFVENTANGIDNCEPVIVSKEQLEELLNRAKRVKATSRLISGKVNNGYHFVNGKEEPIVEDGKIIENPSVAIDLLPTTSGFFFGSTDYDQWYLEDIKSTIKQISAILDTTDWDNEYVTYEASW